MFDSGAQQRYIGAGGRRRFTARHMMETVEGATGDRWFAEVAAPADVRLIEALSDQAVCWAIERRFGEVKEVLAAGATPPRLRMRGELYEILEFLAAAAATGRHHLFEDYIQWLRDVFGSRMRQDDGLPAMLRLLHDFFGQRLGPMSAEPVTRLISAGISIADGAVTRLPQPPVFPAPLAGADELARCLVAGNIGGARAMVRRLDAGGLGYVQIATRLFQPALYAVGQLWQRNEITVAQEHLASAIAQTILTQMFIRDDFLPRRDDKALFACVSGNSHALGLRLVCDAFELKGWSVQFVGSSVPAEALIAHIDSWRPQLVCLSASLVPQLPELRRLVAEIRATFGGRRPAVIVGGLATNEIASIWEWIGADEWFPDAEAASARGG